MSAALVESVRLAYAELHGLCDGSRKFTMSIPVRADRDSDMVIGRGLDAAAAALTEAEALKIQLAASQAREVALREALNDLYGYAHRQAPLSRFEGGVPVALLKGLNALSAPTDTAALRAMLTQVARSAMSCGGSRANAGLDFVFDLDVESIVDRVLGGS